MYQQSIVQVVQTESVATRWQQQTSALNVGLERTSEPVWPEDEAAELAQPGATAVPPLDQDEANAALRGISVELPDRLMSVPVQQRQLGGLLTSTLFPGASQALPAFSWAVPGCDHVAFSVPASFAAPESLILCRIRLDLVLSSDGDDMPVAVYLKPEPAVEVNVHKVAELSADLGRLLTSVVPHLPSVFTARVGGSIDVESVHPKIQVTGLQRHECSWRVADSHIAYGFSPSLVAQFPASHQLRVSARLHVEVRKRVLGVFHKTYGKSASPMTYLYERGQPFMTAFGYFSRIKELGHEQDLYREHLAGTGAMVRVGDLAGERDPGEAQGWYRRAADAGDVEAMLKLGQLVADQREAAQWNEQAASAGGSSVMLRLGDLAGERDPAEAQGWYRRAADAGDVEAMLKLGQLVADQREAAQWNEQAASAGGSSVMLRLGDLARERDPGEAQGWYRRAADAGDVEAMLKLGHLVEDWDHREAGQWYQKAAAAGNREAKQSLKKLYPWRHMFMRRRP